MARDAITVTALGSNAVTADPAGVAINPTDDGSVTGYPLEEVVLRVVGASGGQTCTVKAGANPPASAAGLGDYVTSIGSGSVVFLGPFESARFEQGSNVLHLDVSKTSTVSAFHLPRNF